MKQNKPLYKIGSKVAIKSDYDPGCDPFSYKFVFTEEMLEEYGGRIMTVISLEFRNLKDVGVKDDGFMYTLVEDEYLFSWASSMSDPEF